MMLCLETESVLDRNEIQMFVVAGLLKVVILVGAPC